MTDISFKGALDKVKTICTDFEEIVDNPEIVVEKAKDMLSGEILVNEEEFMRIYGVSFQKATQEQRDKYIALIKVVNNVTDQVGKAVVD